MNPPTRQRWSLRVITSALTLGVVGLYVAGAFTTLQAGLTDRFFTIRDTPKDIIVVAIDETTLAALGQWPFSRVTHATLLDNLSNARWVAFDVIFSEASNQGTSDDQALETALEAFSGTVVLPQVIDEQSGRVVDPLPRLAQESQIGFVNTILDRDGVVRQAELVRGKQLSFDAVVAGANAPAQGAAIINYYGPAASFTTVSYLDVHRGALPESLFRDKTVLVGASAAGLGDTFSTPFGSMPGVEIHANTIAMLRSGETLTTVPLPFAVGELLLIALLVYMIVTRFKRAAALYGALAVVSLLIVVSAYLLFALGYLVPHFYGLLLFTLVTGVLLLLQYVFETREKAFIKKGFSQYVATEVVEELARHPDKLTLGGETKILSILFSDIRGFTTLSEQLTPQELMEQLNEYLEEMSEAIMNRRGLVDKYIGDAVMAFWGAPLANDMHAADACRSVIDMKQALADLNKRWAAGGRPPFAIGVGISTGDVVVGNMGSKRRFNYSIIGDEVNFAARIEGLTKQYGVFCLIGEQTYQAVTEQPDIYTRELDDVMVKGKKEPRRIYELLTEEITPDKQRALDAFAAGRQAYRDGDFKAAITHFTEALNHDNTDGPSQVFLERAKTLLENPPEAWNGVFEFTSK